MDELNSKFEEKNDYSTDTKKQKRKGKKKKKKKQPISYNQEILRKLIHLFSLSIPVVYYHIDKVTALSILFPLALLAVSLDFLSKGDNKFAEFIQHWLGKMMRAHEKKKDKIVLNGASWVLISAYLTVLIFPKIIAVTGFAILIISDLTAALIGRKFGKHALFNKSWEGTLSFMVSAIMVVIFVGTMTNAPWVFYLAGAIGAIVAGFVEAAAKILKADDNLTIPLSFGVVVLSLAEVANQFGVSILNIL
jgi:dolichol kinase